MTDDRRLTMAAHPAFYSLALARMLSGIAFQMLIVALGWQLYNLTNSPLDLGLVGLVSFGPMLIATPLAGLAADTFDRRRIAAITTLVSSVVVLGLAIGTYQGWTGRAHIFASVAVLGLVRTFEFPTMSAMVPLTVPREMLSQATALYSSANQTAVILGPAFGGLLYWLGAWLPYAVAVTIFLIACLAVSRLDLAPQVRRAEGITRASLSAGLTFIWRTPELLGALSLDLVAVGLSGAAALMPVVARDILHVGPMELGILRAAPAVGALSMAIWLARFPIRNKAGLKMFAGVAGFGLATIVFGISQSFTLSLLALALLGAADVISVVVRQSLVQLRTPDEMRGRVGAVNAMFISASNQLGDFRAGAMAAAFGTGPAVIAGGIAAIAIAALWMRLFPMLTKLERPEI